MRVIGRCGGATLLEFLDNYSNFSAVQIFRNFTVNQCFVVAVPHLWSMWAFYRNDPKFSDR